MALDYLGKLKACIHQRLDCMTLLNEVTYERYEDVDVQGEKPPLRDRNMLDENLNVFCHLDDYDILNCVDDTAHIKRRQKEKPSVGLVNLSRQYDGKGEKSRDESERVPLSYLLAALAWFRIGQAAVGLTFRHVLSLVLWVFMPGSWCSACSEQRGSSSARVGKPIRFTTLRVPALALLLFCCFSQASPSELHTTTQALPQACTDWFTMDLKDCPEKDVWPKEWDKLNTMCCPDFPGTVLHCQRRSFENGDPYNFPACLPEQTVPAGQAGMLETDSDGNPKFVTRPCIFSYFEDTDRMSSGVAFPYCTQPKSECSGDGQELLCHGGPTGDDSCSCAAGYQPRADRCLGAGFSYDDGCECVPMSCPPSQCAVRTPSHLEPAPCADRKQAVHFVCLACPSTPVTTLSASVFDTSLTTPDGTESKRSGSEERSKDATPPPASIEKSEDSAAPSAGTEEAMGTGYKVLYGFFIGFQVVCLIALLALVVIVKFRAQ